MDAAVELAFAVHPLGDAGVAQQLGRSLLQDAGADALLDVLARSILEDDALDSRQFEEPGEREARRARADDADLGPPRLQPAFASSSSTRWKT
jgi:hypothetical protein